MATAKKNDSGVILIGDVKGVFTDRPDNIETDYPVIENTLDAIHEAANDEITAVGVVMSSLGSRLTSALKAIREVNTNVRIILFAKMYEEPLAIEMISNREQGRAVADDYILSPISFDEFTKFISEVGRSALPAIDRRVQEKIKQLEKLATTDELTGLKNRRYIWEFAKQIIEYAKGNAGRVTLLIFDIDNFKHYNDVYGHSAGDEILKQAAVLMQQCCRGHDIVGRIGGDEFAVIFWDHPKRKKDIPGKRRGAVIDHPKEPIFISKRFMQALQTTEFPSLGTEGKGVLTISGGLASFPRDGLTPDDLFKQADKAMLEAKRSGKNLLYLVGKAQNDIADIE